MTTISHYSSTPSRGREGAFSAEALDSVEGSESHIEGTGELSTVGILPIGTAEADAALHVMPASTEIDDGFDSFVGGAEALPPPSDTEELRRWVNERQHSDDSDGSSSNSGSSDTEANGLPSGIGGQGVTIFTQGGGGSDLLQIILQAVNQHTRRTQLDRSIVDVTINGERVERGLDDKLDNLQKKLDSSESGLAVKIFSWLAMIVGAIVSALSLGLLSGPMALMAGVIGLVLASYTLAQQIAVEVTDGDYYPGEEWAKAAEVFGMDPEDAKKFGEIFNTALIMILSVLSAVMGLGAAFNIGKGSTDIAQMSVRMTRVAQGAELSSTVTEAGSSASGIADSGIVMHNTILDADSQDIQAWLEQLGMTKEQLILFIQHMLDTLNKMTALGQDMLEHHFSSLQSMIKRPHMV